MKHTPLFIGVLLLFSIWMSGCDYGSIAKPEQITPVEEIVLYARYYAVPPVENWTGGWEAETHTPELKLSKLLYDGELKGDTEYEVTVSGTVDVGMDALQLVFTVPGDLIAEPWIDLTDPSQPRRVRPPNFSITETLKTYKQVTASGISTERAFNIGELALTNDIETNQDDANKPKAILTNVVITIREK